MTLPRITATETKPPKQLDTPVYVEACGHWSFDARIVNKNTLETHWGMTAEEMKRFGNMKQWYCRRCGCWIFESAWVRAENACEDRPVKKGETA